MFSHVQEMTINPSGSGFTMIKKLCVQSVCECFWWITIAPYPTILCRTQALRVSREVTWAQFRCPICAEIKCDSYGMVTYPMEIRPWPGHFLKGLIPLTGVSKKHQSIHRWIWGCFAIHIGPWPKWESIYSIHQYTAFKKKTNGICCDFHGMHGMDISWHVQIFGKQKSPTTSVSFFAFSSCLFPN